jgi:predicted ATPase
MNWVKHNIRLNPSQNRTLNILAEQHGKSRYAMLARIIKSGFAATLNGSDSEENFRELAIETGRNSARLIALERMTERSLYTACAAYVYARDAALKRGHSDVALGAEVQAAFERQCRLTEDQPDEPQ